MRQTLLLITNSENKEKSLISVPQQFFVVLTKLSFWQGDWVLNYYCMEFIPCL